MISAVIVDSGSGPTTTWSSVLGDETRLAANEHASPDSTIVPVGTLQMTNASRHQGRTLDDGTGSRAEVRLLTGRASRRRFLKGIAAGLTLPATSPLEATIADATNDQGEAIMARQSDEAVT
jgi:hypothetical protein